ncbi:hypothetical protein DOTSEDRAFT_69136, partial [Dothistroma septosporum NZE10]
MVAMKDLRLQLGTNGGRWETKVLMRCVKRITESGLIRRMTAKYHDKYGAPIRVAGTKRDCVAHAIQLLREPTEQDRTTWRASDQSIKLDANDSDADEDDSGIEDAAGEINDEAGQGAFVADADPARKDSQSAAVDEGIISDDEGRVVLEDDLDALDTSEVRIQPQWTPDLPLVNVFHRLIAEAGQQGISAMDLGTRISGPSWRRPIDQNMLLLTDVGQYSQPAHLKHLAIVRDTAVRDKFSHYRYRTRPNLDKAVAAGEVTTQPTVVGKGKQKLDDCLTALDEWGFPRVLLKDLANRDGRATLPEGRRGVQFELVDDSDHGGEHEAQDAATSTSTSALVRHPSVTTFDMDRAAATPMRHSVTSTPAMVGDTGIAFGLPDPKAQSASEIMLNVAPKPTRTPKPKPKPRDFALPSKGRYIHKRGPYRRRRPEERPAAPLVKKREIPQHEYDDFDRTAESMAERQVLAEMRASKKRSVAVVDGNDTPDTSRQAGRTSITSPRAAQHGITLADLPSERVAEVKEDILARKKPGVYINPPGARTTKIENFIQLGRPRNALIAVIKTDRLQHLDWFHAFEAPRFAPKASKRRTSRVGNFSRAAKTPRWVEDSESEEEDAEVEEEEDADEGEEEQVQSPSADAENTTLPVSPVSPVEVDDGHPVSQQEQPIGQPQVIPTDPVILATPTDEPPAKRRQLHPPGATGRARVRYSRRCNVRTSQDSAFSVFSARPGSAMDARFSSTPRVSANAVNNIPHQDPRVTRAVESSEQRQQAAARGLAAALAHNEVVSQTPQPSANDFGLDGQQENPSSVREVSAKRVTSSPFPPEELVSDDEFETVASMMDSRPQDLETPSDVYSEAESDVTDEWVPPVSQKPADREQRSARLGTSTDFTAQPVMSAPVEAIPTISPSTTGLGAAPLDSGTRTSAHVCITVVTNQKTLTSPAQATRPAEHTANSSVPITYDEPVQTATPAALVRSTADDMTPARELKMLMAKPGRKNKATHARMAELNRQIELEKAATPPCPTTATPPPRVEAASSQAYTSKGVETFDKAYVDAHPNEEFHHRGKGRWARGPRDFQIRNDRVPATSQQDAPPRSSKGDSEEMAATAASHSVRAETARSEVSASVGPTKVTADAISRPSQAVPAVVYQTFSSEYVDQHADEDFYHRGQGRWARGLPPPGSSGRTGVRGPGAQAWKMSVLGYGIAVKTKKQTPSVTTPTARMTRSAEMSDSLLAKLPLPQRRLTETRAGIESTSSQT